MGDKEPWTRKYQPRKPEDIVGQDNPVRQVLGFASDYRSQKKKSAIIYGPVGCGKTVSVYAAADQLGLEVIEVNASDFRNQEQINSVVGAASKQMSLFSKGKIILIDEVDGLSGTKDRGAVPALVKLMQESSFPIICTAVDPFDKKLSALRKKAVMVEFSMPDYKDIYSVLKIIADHEGIKYDENDMKSIARRAGGDIRAAVNDLQILTSGKRELLKEDLESMSQREQTENILNAVMKVLKTTDPNIAIQSFNNVQEDFDKVMLWMDENIPKEYEKPADLARAYDYLSKADVMSRRIRRWQHWRFIVYINAYLSAGVAVSKDEKYSKFVKYGPTSRLLKIWMANRKYQKRKAIAEKIAEKTHTSAYRVLQDTLPYMQAMFQKDIDYGTKLADELELEKAEVEWLCK
ncbi:replication factor C large subunit [Candidatus Woesearchaeota archaeon]|nr:replication factor C large subunit [Candidatus Woesearchaeota archaeon]